MKFDRIAPYLIGLCLVAMLSGAVAMGVLGCFNLPPFAPAADPRTAEDIDGDGILNGVDDDMDGDGLPNDEDPDANSDGRFDRSIVVDFPFDHNAFIEPMLPPNHPDFDYQGRLVIPAGHIDISDIIGVNQETHPLEFLQPKAQDQLAMQDRQGPSAYTVGRGP